jgi:uncharacterized protein YegP (UPF0339 family)
MKFDVYRESDGDLGDLAAPGDWRWRLRARNGRIVAEGGEGYKRATDLVKSVKKYMCLEDVARWAAFRLALHRAGLTAEGHPYSRNR